VYWISDAILFAAGKKGHNSLTDHDQSATLHKEGTGQGDGEGLGQCPIAFDAFGRNKGRHMHSMDSACHSALGVPDAAVQELQRVPSASGRGT
jgi:hypothetical protein